MNDFANWPHVMFRDWCSDMTLTIPQFFSPESYKDWLKLKHQELETRKYEAEVQVKVAELKAQKALEDLKIAHTHIESQLKFAELQAEAQMKMAELQANTSDQKILEDAKIAQAQTKIQLKQTEAQVKLAELQVRRASDDVNIAQAEANKAEWDAKAKIAECRQQMIMHNKKREREETMESMTTTPTKTTKQSHTSNPSLADRVAACTQIHQGARSFSHAVYQKMQDLGGNVNIVTMFQYVQEWFRAEQRKGFHVNAPRGLDWVVIVYGNNFSDDLLEFVATECLKKAPSHVPCTRPVVVASFRPVSLLSAALADLPHDQRTATTTLLIDKFVYSQAMGPWHGVTCFIVRHRVTQKIEDIRTYVDVRTHPMVTTLRNWLLQRTMDTCAPEWSPADALPKYDYPDNAGLGSFNGFAPYNELVRAHEAIRTFLQACPGLRNGMMEECVHLTKTVHPDQTVFFVFFSQQACFFFIRFLRFICFISKNMPFCGLAGCTCK